MKDRSFVMPDVLFARDLSKHFFSPKFFQPNQIAFFGADGSDDFCKFVIELIGQVDVEVVFFKRELVKQCADHSLIYKCAFRSVEGVPFPEPQGNWRRNGDTFELALYHHTNETGEDGIKASGEIWSSAWNIAGTTELKNIAYGYFTCIPQIENLVHLQEIAMSETGVIHFLPTNAPINAQFAHQLRVYRQTTADRDRRLKFWVDAEIIAPNHIWLHRPMSKPAYYEIVLPNVFRIGVKPGRTIPFNGAALTIKPKDCKSFKYVIVGDADTQEGLSAPFHEEETMHLAKVDAIPVGTEIIGRWYEKQNTLLYPDIDVELVELVKDRT